MTSKASKRFSGLVEIVLRKLSERQYSPVELFQELQSAHVSESAVKDALAALMDARVIEFSPDRRITVRDLQSRDVRKAG